MSKNANNQGVIHRDVSAAQRAAQAVQLRAKKLTYEQIANECGYASAGAARNAIMRELNRAITPGINAMRLEELSMLDQLHAAVWPLTVPTPLVEDEDDEQPVRRTKKRPAAEEVNLLAVKSILDIAERRAKLLGLDTPVKVADHKNVIVIREVPAGLLLQPGVEAGS